MVYLSMYDLRDELRIVGADVLNAFSINMLARTSTIDFARIDKETAQWLLDGVEIRSHIGHQDTAVVVSNDLGIDIPMVRDTFTFKECAIVAQYTGPRLAEGTTTLPEDAEINYWLVQA